MGPEYIGIGQPSEALTSKTIGVEPSLSAAVFANKTYCPTLTVPTGAAVVGTTYDMYSLVFTKDGSTSPQIKGVDNLMEMYIAAPAGDADNLIFEGKLNPWIASAGFGPINL